jgi:hypothetical protein
VEVKKFVYQNAINIKADITGGPSSPISSSNINIDTGILPSISSQNCCYQYLSQFIVAPGPTPRPEYTPNWPIVSWTSDSQGYLYDYRVPRHKNKSKNNFFNKFIVSNT